MHKAKLSVIVPIYKVEPFLKKCVESILSQDYDNLEVILVDDGSPDDCPKICDEYATMDCRVKVIHKSNGGLCSARNAGLDVANGDYVTFVDSDDYIEPYAYSSMMSYMADNQLDIIGGGYRYFRPWKTVNKMLEAPMDGSFKILRSEAALDELYFGSQMFLPITIMVWNKIYRKSLFNNLRFPEGYIFEDTLITPMLLNQAKKIGVLNKLVYTYNIHLGSNSTSGMKAKQKVDSGVEMSKRVYEYFKGSDNNKVSNKVTSIYVNSLLNGYFQCSISGLKERDWNTKGRLFKTELKKIKKDALKTEISKPLKIFYFSPILFVALKYVTIKTKFVRYKIKRFITGKN